MMITIRRGAPRSQANSAGIVLSFSEGKEERASIPCYQHIQSETFIPVMPTGGSRKERGNSANQ